MNKRKIMIATGGTGGHIFPAISLAHQLKERGDLVMFVGGGLGCNPFFQKEIFSYQEVSCAKLSWKTPAFPLHIAKGFWQSVRLLKKFEPKFVIGFGSYYTFPALLAARYLRIPYVIHEQNSVPGRVNRFFTKSARLTAIHFPTAADKIKGACRQAAMPLRPEFQKKWKADEAKKKYGLSSDLPVLLVFGGSQGAEFINRLLHEAASRLKAWQILHFTGNAEQKRLLAEKYQAMGINAFVNVFETDMAGAWAAADCVISRAGAVSIAEQLATSVPGILIPYPFSADSHQELNADFLVKLGGAVKLDQNRLTCDRLIDAIERIAPQLEAMRLALKKHHECQYAFVDCLEEI